MAMSQLHRSELALREFDVKSRRVSPNASTGPDFMGIKLKAHRGAASSKKVTLFAKTPDSDPGGTLKLLDLRPSRIKPRLGG